MMSPKKQNNGHERERILSRVPSEEFVGRAGALDRIVKLSGEGDARGLLLLLAPSAGVSELLRQSYDRLFHSHTEVVPVYFSLYRREKSPAVVARRFLYSFLQQLSAFNLREPRLVTASLTKTDLLDLSPPADYEWIERLLAIAESEGTQDDEESLVRLCLSAPERAATRGVRSLVMIDAAQLIEPAETEISLGAELVRSLTRSRLPFVLAGLRRQVLDLVHSTLGDFDGLERLHLERLDDREAGELVEYVSRREAVELNDSTRDLVVQQLDGSPLFINAMVEAAREKQRPLTSFRNCQRIYVEEVMGGRINRHFSAIMDELVPASDTRRALIRLLYETSASDTRKSTVEVWRKRLDVTPSQLQRLLHGLHIHELANVTGSLVEMKSAALVWRDYLRARYEWEVAGEPRASVLAGMLTDLLKRAPQTMERHYRREAAVGLSSLLARFDCQRVPASLLHFDRFSRLYKGITAEEAAPMLEAETDLVRLPQIVSVANTTAFHPPVQMQLEEERSAIAHGFDAGSYSEASEVVWLAAEIDSKMEAGRGLAEMWHNRLMHLARTRSFERARVWLVSAEGFTPDAMEFLNEQGVYTSSRRQLEFLTARLGGGELKGATQGVMDEFELAIPMGEETELIAAHTVEQIARRFNFQPEAINQIKTALIEACINATEHSLSTDRKIYQRFRLESDRLVVTVSSRGLRLPERHLETGAQGRSNGNHQDDNGRGRRGWGLKLIRTLMDEVEFESVDDGTRLRMTKYLRKP
ncbi:MAG TPA: ATP-binding protein [Pyrinomonadaceae bacterium]|nr:ATP-binding protein [Pyrinomonadaceae bacterium]